MPEKGEMTVREAGRRGAAALREQYSPEHFQAIGKKGGMKTAATHGSPFYQEIGRKSGAKRRARRVAG